MTPPKYSVVVPVYNRPMEVEELLDSLTRQSFKDFEVILVEDGSTVTSQKVFEKYSGQLSIQYFVKPNTGPGPSRNFGFERAKGNFFVVFDSDCIVPPGYFEAIEKHFRIRPLDAWGGPDRAHENFTPIQRAMGYTMSSILTTGGIRGGKKSFGTFQPRSFNMGISREVFQNTGGFKFDRYAEDIELSIRIKKSGFKVGLISEAFVFHKRRTDLKQFYRQVMNFGQGRAQVGRVHPTEIKVTHWVPSLFLLGFIFSCFLIFIFPVIGKVFLGIYAFYFLVIVFHSFLTNKSVEVAVLSLPSAIVQLTGYGVGFLREMFKPYI